MTRLVLSRFSNGLHVAFAIFLFHLSAMHAQSADFYTDVFPILKANCIACHNSQKSDGGLNLESFEALQKGGDSGATYTADSAEKSNLVRRIKGEDELMPPKGNNVGARQLTPSEINLIQSWIVEGALAGTNMNAPAKVWQPLPESIKPIYSIDTSNLGQTTVVGRGNQAIVHEWAALGSQESFVLSDHTLTERYGKPTAHLDIVQSVAVSNDGNRIATGGYRDVKIWKRVWGKSDSTLGKKLRASTQIAVSSDGNKVARTTETPTIEVYDTTTAQLIARWDSNTPIQAISWSTSSQSLWTISNSGDLFSLVIDANQPGITKHLSTEKSISLGTTPTNLRAINEQVLVGVTQESNLVGWKASIVDGTLNSIEPVSAFTSFNKVNDVARLTDALFAVSSLEQNTIQIVNAHDGSVARSIESSPNLRLFAPTDGTRLIGSDVHGKSSCWNVNDGKLLWENLYSKQIRTNRSHAETEVARQKAKVDRSINAIPEWEKNKAAEEANLTKVTKSRDEANEAVNKKNAEMMEAKNQMIASESAVESASKVLEEAKMKLEAAQKDLTAKKEQVAAIEKAKVDLEQKLMAWNGTVQAATEAVDKVTKSFADFQTKLAQLKEQLIAIEKKKSDLDAVTVSAKVVAGVVTPDSRRFVTHLETGELRVICLENGESERSLNSDLTIKGLLFADSQSRLFQIDLEGRCNVWDLGTRWELERTIGNAEDSPFSDRITAMTFSLDGSQLVVGSGPPSRFGELKLLSVADGSIAKDWGQIHSDTILCVRISPDGSTVASSGADKLVKLHDLRGEENTRTLEGHTHHVLGIAWHDDGFLLASSSADNTIKIWDVESGQATRTITGFGKEVTALAFAGRTNQLVSSSTDHQVRLHDVTSGSQIRVFSGAADAMYSLAVVSTSPADGGGFLISGGQQGIISIWKIADGAAIKQIK